MFSLFSEYEPHLLEDYSLFYLDTSFRSGTENTDEICSHLWHFMEENLTGLDGESWNGLELKGVNVKNMVRATDGGGAVFYRQAIRVMKQKTGAELAEEWLLQDGVLDGLEESGKKFQEDCVAYQDAVRNYDDEEDEVDSEAYQWDGLTENFTLSLAVPGTISVSDKGIVLSKTPSHRELSVGTGQADGSEDGLVQKQWFLSYLCDYLDNACEGSDVVEENGWLDYRMEYVLCGNASDAENLTQVIQRLLLVREGVNYTFLLSHSEMSQKAELLANLLVGLTGNRALVDAVKHLILLGWAYGESVVEVRQLLGGCELSILKSEEDWQLPLSGVFAFFANPSGYDTQAVPQQGLDYEAYLRGFLSLQSADTLAMRTLDVIEGELQSQKGAEQIHVDHCVEELTAQVWMEGIYLERSYCYE